MLIVVIRDLDYSQTYNFVNYEDVMFFSSQIASQSPQPIFYGKILSLASCQTETDRKQLSYRLRQPKRPRYQKEIVYVEYLEYFLSDCYETWQDCVLALDLKVFNSNLSQKLVICKLLYRNNKEFFRSSFTQNKHTISMKLCITQDINEI